MKQPKKSYWIEDTEFDPATADQNNLWGGWVGTQTPAEFMAASDTDDIANAVEAYLDDCPRMFPEAAGTVSREWLSCHLQAYIETNIDPFRRVVFNCLRQNYAKLEQMIKNTEARDITAAINRCIQDW